MQIIYGNTEEIIPYFQEMETQEEEGIVYYKGFDLMRPAFFEELGEAYSPEFGCQYLLAVEDNRVIGVLKWKRYGIPDHEYVSEEASEETESYNAIRFVDIKKSNRQQGVAKKLVQALSERLDEADYVVGGRATPSGEEANIHDWMKRELAQLYYQSEITLIEEWEEENEIY